MSIYSGFPTRKDETKYNDLLSRLLLMMQQHLMECIEGSQLPPKKVMGYTKVISKMKEYQQHKYLPPKFTELLQPLCKAIGYNNVAVSCDQVQIADDRNKHKLQRLNTVKLSSEKYRLGSRFGDESVDYGKFNKKGSFYEQNNGNLTSQANQAKKKMFESSSTSKNMKAKRDNGDQSKQRGELPNHNSNYEEDESVRTHSRSQQTRIITSHTNLPNNKIKNNLRYRALNALTDAQENVKKRQLPLRQEMKRRLKTSGEGADSDI